MSNDKRPTPDSLLALAEEEDRNARRGKLKIFFGSSAGVGKTYSMLSAAQELAQQGIAVVVGVIETHQRPHTKELLDGLELIEPLAIPYRGLTIKELDLDKALRRHPHTILVDELAHTNTPGSRHPKRWNDVMELLDAGINVYTTLNVQHIESLSDIIAGTTGVWVKETVPDSVFDMADDIVLVDIDSDDLLKRLHEGNIYIAPEANRRAAENFFKKDNLNALREIALRRTAQRVDAERDLFHDSAGRQPVAEKILVCVAPDASAAKLIRTAKRITSALKAPWTALYVERGDPQSMRNAENRRVIETLERMASRLDGKMVTVHGDDLLDEIMSYARNHGITKIIVGKTISSSLMSYFHGRLINQIIRASGPIDVIVVTEEESRAREPTTHASLSDLKPYNYLLALFIMMAFTLPGFFLSNLLTGTDQALLYLTGIVLVAENMGMGPSLFYALMAASTFILLFSDKNHFHAPDNRSYIMTFLVMLVTGYAIAKQSSKLKTQAISSRSGEAKAKALYELTRKLTATRGRFPVSEIIGVYLAKTLDVEVTVWMTNQEGHPAVVLGNLPEDTYYKDFGTLQWCYENSKNAGRGTSTMPSAAGFYTPLMTSTGTLGVLGVFAHEETRQFTFDDIASIETLASLLSSALERVRAGEIAQQTVLAKEGQKLREALISTLGQGYTKETKESAQDATQNLAAPELSLLNRVPSSLADCIEKAIARIATTLDPYTLQLDIPVEIPDVLIDAPMIEQLFINLLESAAKVAPEGTPLTITATRKEGEIIVSVADEGPALGPDQEGDLFSSLGSPSSPQTGNRAGPALAISAGIVRLHGGHISAQNRPEKGVLIAFSLPQA